MVLKIQFCTKWILFNKNEFWLTKFLTYYKFSILYHKSQFCVTKVNFVRQKSSLCHKSQFCVTELNFSQKTILRHKIQFCETKWNFVTKSIWYAKQFTESFGYANEFSHHDLVRFLIGYSNRGSRRRMFLITSSNAGRLRLF